MGRFRNSFSRLGNSRKSVNVLTSVSGLKFSVRAARSQKSEPVSSPKCQAIAARKYATGTQTGEHRGQPATKKPYPPSTEHVVAQMTRAIDRQSIGLTGK